MTRLFQRALKVVETQRVTKHEEMVDLGNWGNEKAAPTNGCRQYLIE